MKIVYRSLKILLSTIALSSFVIPVEGAPVRMNSLVKTVPAKYDLGVNNPRIAIVRAEVLKQYEPTTSYDHPASVSIKVLDVLRGRGLAVSQEFNAKLFPLNKKSEKARRYKVPAVGEQILLAFCCVDGGKRYQVDAYGPPVQWSADNEQFVRENMASPNFDPTIQFALLLAIPVLTVLAGIFAFSLSFSSINRLIQSKMRMALFSLPFVVYVVYESNMPSFMIRLDMIYIVPSLALSMWGMVWSVMSYMAVKDRLRK